MISCLLISDRCCPIVKHKHRHPPVAANLTLVRTHTVVHVQRIFIHTSVNDIVYAKNNGTNMNMNIKVYTGNNFMANVNTAPFSLQVK
jgi:hypothetical protein